MVYLTRILYIRILHIRTGAEEGPAGQPAAREHSRRARVRGAAARGRAHPGPVLRDGLGGGEHRGEGLPEGVFRGTAHGHKGAITLHTITIITLHTDIAIITLHAHNITHHDLTLQCINVHVHKGGGRAAGGGRRGRGRQVGVGVAESHKRPLFLCLFIIIPYPNLVFSPSNTHTLTWGFLLKPTLWFILPRLRHASQELRAGDDADQEQAGGGGVHAALPHSGGEDSAHQGVRGVGHRA
jgi:hypothetical protein